MTRQLVHRPARITEPLAEAESQKLSAPPALSDGKVGGTAMHTLIPVVGSLGSVTMIVVMRNSNPMYMVMGAMLLVVALVAGVGFAVSQRGHASRDRRTQRELYLDYLERLRAEKREQARTVREQAATLDPEPSALLEVIRDPGRLWERRRLDPDFLRVRIGSGDLRWIDLSLPPEDNPIKPYDPIMKAEAEAVAEHYGRLLGVPITVRLDGAGAVSVIGDRADVVAVARSMALQLAALHAPEDLVLAAAFAPEQAEDWQGFDLLPQVIEERLFDAGVPARRIAPTTEALSRVLGAELADRAEIAATVKRSIGTDRPPIARMVVFCDDYGRPASRLTIPDADLELAELQITTVHLLSDRLQEPSDVSVRITIDDHRATVTDNRPRGEDQLVDPPAVATIDTPSTELFGTVARALAPLRLSVTEAEVAESTAGIKITDLLGIDNLADVGPELWRPRSPRDFLRVPIGLDDYGAPVLLDLKESADLGMGPHGICIGATGSGKSEMLRTLVLALGLSHPPEDLSMILVDYKGGAAFDPFIGMPHIAGIMDNLADDPQLIERARASISGEVVRRQERLKQAGSSSISHYRELRAENERTGGPSLPPMPHLFVVIDEFGELLTAEPDFIDLLIQIGRIGRSIGVHLLLSSQRIEGGKLRGLDTYLSYRIGLRTFSEAESSVVLDTPDAFRLPAIPGYGYLKVDTSVYRRFRSGYVSGAAEAPAEPQLPQSDEPAPEPMVLPTFNTLQAALGSTEEGEAELTAPMVGRPLVAECVDRLRAGAVARTVTPVWLPPLPNRLALSRVIGDGSQLDALGAHGGEPDGLRVPLGLLDEPAKQRQGTWLLDLGRAGGHHAVIGAPGTGRSTFLRTMAVSLALTHTPRQVSVYGMDLTGAGLRRIEGFPHVGGVSTRAHPDRLRRLLEELAGMLAVREDVFRDRGIESVAMLRSEHAAGRVPELVSAEIVLLVDGVGQLRSDFEELEDPLFDLLQRGGSYGIHLVLALNRWNDIRIVHQPMIGTRFELRLNDPMDSVIGRKLNAILKADQPGRVLTDDEHFAQIALPVLDDTGEDDLGAAVQQLAERSAQSWQGPAAAPIRLLPTDLDPQLLPDALDEPDALPFGLRQDTMEPAVLELNGLDQHVLIFGDPGSGKTTALRTLVRGLLDRYTADELVIAVMDLRGEIAAEVPDDYMGGHATSAGLARGLSAAIANELEQRMAGITTSGGTPAVDPALDHAALDHDAVDHDELDRDAVDQGSVDHDAVDQGGVDDIGVDHGQGEQPTGRVGGGPRIVVIADDFDILDSAGAEPLGPLLPFLPSARDLRLHVFLSRPVAGIGRAMFGIGLQTLRDTGGTVLLLSGERAEGQVLPGLYAESMVPGRGRMVRRGDRPRTVQIANSRADDQTVTEGGRHAS